MAKKKRALDRAEKAAKARRKAELMTIFVNGRQKSVPRPILIEGMDAAEFIRLNADPIWRHQNEMWEDMYLMELEATENDAVPPKETSDPRCDSREDDDIPF